MKRALPEVNFSDYGDVRYLHLGTEWVQGSMKLDAPFEIELEYVQRMMAWLLFVDPAEVPKRHAMQLGLGAASLTKFCRKALRMRTTAIELNPQVVAACRGWFKLPADDARLRVVVADAARPRSASPNGRARSMRCRSTCTTTRPRRRCSTARTSMPTAAALLTEDGCMTVNLFGRSSSYERSLEKIAAAFGEEARLGLPADARGQHRRAGPAQRPAGPSAPRLPSAPKASRLAGACPRPSGCGCSNRMT